MSKKILTQQVGFYCVEVDHGGGASAMDDAELLVVAKRKPAPDAAGSGLRSGFPCVQVDARPRMVEIEPQY